jgi:hypothetical protein
VGIYEIPATSPDRLGQTDTLVVYKVGNNATLQVKIPKSNPTTSEVDAAIRADWAKKAALMGREIEM